jgi:hypothetical protein
MRVLLQEDAAERCKLHTIDNRPMVTNLMEMRSTPFRGMFTSMAIEYSEKTLPSYGVKVDDEGMGILHGTTGTHVFGDTDAKCRMICRVTIEDLYLIRYIR